MADLLTEIDLTEACTLPTVARPLRLAEFDVLFAQHLSSVEEGQGHARLRFRGEPGLGQEVARLAGRESACCSFFTFVVGGTDDNLWLTVSVPPDRRDVLTALVARARHLAPSGPDDL